MVSYAIDWPRDPIVADRLLLSFYVTALDSIDRTYGQELAGAIIVARSCMDRRIPLADRFAHAAPLLRAVNENIDTTAREPIERWLAIALVSEAPARSRSWDAARLWFDGLLGSLGADMDRIGVLQDRFFAFHRER